jgi:hypothetical protein
MSQYTTLQKHVHGALLDGVNLAMERYLLSQNWERDDIKRLAFSLTFFDRAFRSETTAEHESNLQNLVSTLTMHKGIKRLMPSLSPIFRDPNIVEFLKNKDTVKEVAKAAFRSYEYKNFKYKVSNPSVPIWDLGGIDFKVKHICPSGVIGQFQGKISYLITKSNRETKLFFRDPRGERKSRRTNIMDLKIKCGDTEISVWRKITVNSVAMIPRKDGEDYTYSDRIAYVELKFTEQGIEEAFRLVGGEGNLKIATKSNLKHYVPKSQWEKFENDIDAAKHVFGEKNKQILNNGSEETKKKSRDALEKLTMYYKSLKDTPEIVKEPQETEDRVTSSSRATSESADEDDRMSIVSEEL